MSMVWLRVFVWLQTQLMGQEIFQHSVFAGGKESVCEKLK